MAFSALARIDGSLHASSSRSVQIAPSLPCMKLIRSGYPGFQKWRYGSGNKRTGLSRRGGKQVVNAVSQEAAGLKYDHLLLAIMDNNPYFSDGSKQAFATAATLAITHNSKVTVLLVDEAKPDGDQATRIETASWHLRENGYDPGNAAFQEVSLAAEESHNSSVVVGNAVDQVDADLVLLSTEAVHSKAVDANLLAEFVDCPVLLLP